MKTKAVKEVAYFEGGTRPSSGLTYAQWCEQLARREKARSKALLKKEAIKYCGGK